MRPEPKPTEAQIHPRQLNHSIALGVSIACDVRNTELGGSHRDFGPSSWCQSHIPFKVILIVCFSCFSVLPAVALWHVSRSVQSEAAQRIHLHGVENTESVALQLRLLLIKSARTAVENQVTRIETDMNMFLNVVRHVQSTMLRDALNVSASIGLEEEAFLLGQFMEQAMYTMKSNLKLSMLLYGISSIDACLGNDAVYFAYVYARMNFNMIAVDNSSTIYRLAGYERGSTESANTTRESNLTVFVLDQQNGAPWFSMAFSETEMLIAPLLQDDHDTFTTDEGSASCFWDSTMTFGYRSGTPDVPLHCHIPQFFDSSNTFHVDFHFNMLTTSTMLRSLVAAQSVGERLFLFFRNREGTLLGASHGKFFSHSDFDFDAVNPVSHPAPISEFRLFSALNSTDEVIRQAGWWLFRHYLDWGRVPELSLLTALGNRSFWIVSNFVGSKYGLRAHLMLVADRDARLSSIDQSISEAMQQMDTTNHQAAVLLVIVSISAFGLAVATSLALTRSLGRLTDGLKGLAHLDLHKDVLAGFVEANRSVFSEMAACENSFLALNRGMKAFAKYVPETVVKLILADRLRLDSATETLVTVMFMDVVGFSSMCETVPPSLMIQQTTLYLQVTCDVITDYGGTIDKFIGDCIMALWNAPRRLPNHQSAACAAALEMQSRVLELWGNDCSIKNSDGELAPQFRFRIGINTDRVLVGNFGCSYRVAYTCVGEGVNIASRLESANKVFGSVVLVHGSTKSAAENDFRFRKVAMVSFPPAGTIVPNSRGTVLSHESHCLETSSVISGHSGGAELLRSPRGGADLFAVYEPLYPTNPSVFSKQHSTCSTLFNTLPPSNATPPCNPLLPSRTSSNAEFLPKLSTAASVASDLTEFVFQWQIVSQHELNEMAKFYEKGLEHFRQGNLTAARQNFLEAAMILPMDMTSKAMILRCEEALQCFHHKWSGVILL